jgi:SHS2 domain-containing protein
VAREENGLDGQFEVIEHTADVGFEARAATPQDLFRAAARALLGIAVDDSSIADRDSWPIEVNGADYPSLLVNFLEEIVFLFDAARFAACDCEIDAISSTHITARLRGEPRAPERHRWKLIVKAVTYHDLEVSQRADGWYARVFLDV